MLTYSKDKLLYYNLSSLMMIQVLSFGTFFSDKLIMVCWEFLSRCRQWLLKCCFQCIIKVLSLIVGFFSVMMFCAAAVIFPAGFEMELIGGRPYQLPSSFRVGISYIFFLLSLWITVISELFAGKMCLPHF